MIEGRNIICFASNWFYDPTSKHHVMRILSERNHVIWVNYHGSRRPRVSTADVGAMIGKIRQYVEGPRRVSDGITVLTPLVVPLPGSLNVARLNRGLMTRQIRSVLRGLPDRPVQLWSFAPDVDYMCGRFSEECVVYYCVDEFSEFSGYDSAAILAAERRLAGRADLVVTTSRALQHAKKALNPDTWLLTHGVDYDHFAKSAGAPIPHDVAQFRGPVFGFWGLLQDWLDVDLLSTLARSRPEWSIVLIGEAATDVSALGAQPNVHLLGRRPYRSLPGYARRFDLGLIPFKVNELTNAVNPIKLREYLSAGLPVVSTPMPEVERYRGFVEIGEAGHDFLKACDRALAQRTSEAARARQAAMRSETWVERVEQLSNRLLSVKQSARVCA